MILRNTLGNLAMSFVCTTQAVAIWDLGLLITMRFQKLVILFFLFFLSTVKADSPAGFHHNHGKNVRLMGEARDRAERSASYNQVNQGTKNWF